VDEVWANWEKIKRAEKHGTKHARASAMDGIPNHLPALLRAEKLVKKARKAKVLTGGHQTKRKLTKATVANELFTLAQWAQEQGWSAEDLLRDEINRREKTWRKNELLARAAHTSSTNGQR
jgi:hypothetical protein